MVTQQLPHEEAPLSGRQVQLFFAGDYVRLYGQIEYPHKPPPSTGYPLMFILQHACCTGLQGHAHYADLALTSGCAVFRWDKRGTGRSGSGGYGSTTLDAVKAYSTALAQPGIDPQHVVILAQNEGTLLLGENYTDFAAVQAPRGVILAGSMLDEQQILTLTTSLHIVSGERDWNLPQNHAEAAAAAHEQVYSYGASYYIARHASRRLVDTRNNMFHVGAAISMQRWLENLCQAPAST